MREISPQEIAELERTIKRISDGQFSLQDPEFDLIYFLTHLADHYLETAI